MGKTIVLIEIEPTAVIGLKYICKIKLTIL